LDGADDVAERVSVAPVVRQLSADDQSLRQLFEQARRAWHQRGERDATPALIAIHERLSAIHPDEWLLRWNLLESLSLLGETEHSKDIEHELEALEARFSLLHPIATGLRSLGRWHGANDALQEAS
jgi:hypothetical protein